MKIQLWHTREHDFEKELYKPIKSSSFYSKHTFLFPHDNENKKWINSRETLKEQNIFFVWSFIFFNLTLNRTLIC